MNIVALIGAWDDSKGCRKGERDNEVDVIPILLRNDQPSGKHNGCPLEKLGDPSSPRPIHLGVKGHTNNNKAKTKDDPSKHSKGRKAGAKGMPSEPRYSGFQDYTSYLVLSCGSGSSASAGRDLLVPVHVHRLIYGSEAGLVRL